MSAWVRLTPAQRQALDEALDPHSLDAATALFLEAHLTSYRDRQRPQTAAGRRRLTTAGRRLLALLASSGDEADALLVVVLQTRLRAWTRGPRPAHRPTAQARRLLIEGAVGVLDDAGFLWKRRSGHRDGPRVRALRVVLQIADTLDGKPTSQGNSRLIAETLRACRASRRVRGVRNS